MSNRKGRGDVIRRRLHLFEQMHYAQERIRRCGSNQPGRKHFWDGYLVMLERDYQKHAGKGAW